MEVIGNTIINVDLTIPDEARLIYQLVKEQESIGFLIFKNDLMELEKIENKLYKILHSMEVLNLKGNLTLIGYGLKSNH